MPRWVLAAASNVFPTPTFTYLDQGEQTDQSYYCFLAYAENMLKEVKAGPEGWMPEERLPFLPLPPHCQLLFRCMGTSQQRTGREGGWIFSGMAVHQPANGLYLTLIQGLWLQNRHRHLPPSPSFFLTLVSILSRQQPCHILILASEAVIGVGSPPPGQSI